MEYAIWIAIMIITVLVDIATSNILLIFFGIGAFVALILQSLSVAFWIQISVFTIVGILLTIILYPVMKKKLKNDIPETLTMERGYIGRTFTAKEDIVHNGRILIDGVYWAVINDGEEIKEGSRFQVIGIKGTKLLVSLNKGE